MNLILCGMPRAGKTAMGETLARQLGWAFKDTDRELEKGHGLTKGELFRKWGEEQFRQKEQRVIASLAPLEPTIIALGGGSLNLVENIRILKTLGTIIYLKIPYPILLERMRQDPPVYMKNVEEELQELMSKRCPIYEAAADQIYEW